jgi:hypothetical protein
MRTARSGSARRTRRPWGTVLLLLGLAAVATGSRLVYLVEPFYSDAAMYAYHARVFAEGGRYGVDFIDNKLHGVGMVLAPIWRAFGAWWPGYVLTQAVLALASCALIWRCLRAHVGSAAGIAGLAFALVYLNMNAAVFGGFQLETTQVFLVCLGLSAAVSSLRQDGKADAFCLGLCCGCAALLKPTGLAMFGAWCLSMIYSRGIASWKQVMNACAGVLVAPVVGLLSVHATGTLATIPQLWAQIQDYATSSNVGAHTWGRPAFVLLIGALPMFFSGFIFRRRRAEHELPTGRITGFALVWFVMELLGVLLQRRMYSYHFLPLAVPAAILFALIPRRLHAGQLLLCLLPGVALSVTGAAWQYEQRTNFVPRLAASDFLLTYAAPHDRVWQDDYPRLLIETGLRPGSRVPMSFLFLNTDTAADRFASTIVEDFDRLRPRWIILPTDIPSMIDARSSRIYELGEHPRRREAFARAWERIAKAVQASHTPFTEIGGETVWVRKADPLLLTHQRGEVRPLGHGQETSAAPEVVPE